MRPCGNSIGKRLTNWKRQGYLCFGRGLLPLGRHTLSIECKGVLSTGVDRTSVGNRVGVGQSFPRLGSLRGCERAHVLVGERASTLRACTRALKKSARMKAVDKCYRDASALLRKTR